MGRLTEDMARLRQNINESRENRLKDNAARSAQEIVRATSVNATIAGFASAHANQAKVDKQSLEAFAAENTRSVVDFLGQLSKQHQAIAQQSREERASFVADLAKSTADLIAEFDFKHKDTSEKAAKERSDFISNLGHEVSSLIDQFNTTRNAQASESAHERSEFFSDLARSISRFLEETKTNRANNAKLSAEERNQFVTSLAGQVASQLDSINQARNEMGKITSEERAAFVSNLASSVADLIHEVASDRAGASAAFFEEAKAEKKKDTQRIVVPKAEVIEPEPEEQIKAEVSAEASNEQEIVQLQVTEPQEQVIETVKEGPEAVTLWDSLVVKKGNHDKPKKKHQGSSFEDKPEKKPDES